MLTLSGPSQPVRTSMEPNQIQYALSFGQSNAIFSPGLPPAPTTAEPVRVFDFNFGQNLQFTPRAYEPFGFPQLRAFSNQELVRLAIETRKDQMERLSWQVKPLETRKRFHDSDDRVRKVERFLRKPDGHHGFATWLRLLLEDLLVLDAPTVEKRRNRKGELVALDVVDGSTIKLLVDQNGRVPLAPVPAYQQVIKGRIWANLTSDDVIYAPRNLRPGHLYGLSPVEQIVVTINMALERQTSQLAWFTASNLPRGYATVPDGWTPDQIKQFQAYYDAMLAGNAAERSKVLWGPHGSTLQPIKAPPIKDEFDEWLARIVTYAFSLPPNAFVKHMNVGTAQDDTTRSQMEGLEPLKLWVKRVLDTVIQDDLGFYDLEFSWKDAREIDPVKQADIDDRMVRLGARTINEVRNERGEDPVDGGDKPMVYLPSGPVLLEKLIENYQSSQDHAVALRALELGKAENELAKSKLETTAATAQMAAVGAAPSEEDEDAGEPAPVIITKAADALSVARAAARDHVDQAANGVDPNPSDAKKLAGNYRKGHVVIAGLDITIETPKGSTRSGTSGDGKPWSVTMPAHYGYLKRTTGADGDHVDVYIGPDPLSRAVFVIDQVDAGTGAFDEHKVMIGYPDAGAATLAYVKAFNDGKGADRLGAMTRMTLAKFKRWLATDDTTKPLTTTAPVVTTIGKAVTVDAGYWTDCGHDHGPDTLAKAAKTVFDSEGPAPNGPLDTPKVRGALARLEKSLTAALATGGDTVAADIETLLTDALANRVAKVTSATGAGDLIEKKLSLKSIAEQVAGKANLAWLSGVFDDLATELSAIAKDTADKILDKAGVKSATARIAARDRAVAWARARAAETVGMSIDTATGKLVTNPNAKMAISDTMRQSIREEIVRGLKAKRTPDQIAKKIAKLGSFTPARARMIARTEIARARNAAVLESADVASQNGTVLLNKSWVNGINACPVCVANAGDGMIPLASEFQSGHAAPPAHPSCMCAVEINQA